MNKLLKKIRIHYAFSVLMMLCCIPLAKGQEDGTHRHTRVTIEKNSISLNDLLSEVRRQTGYDFVFTSSKFDFEKRVNAKFVDAPLMNVLNEYFNVGTGVIYIFKNKTIILLDEDKAEYKLLQGTVINSESKQPVAGGTAVIEEKNINV